MAKLQKTSQRLTLVESIKLAIVVVLTVLLAVGIYLLISDNRSSTATEGQTEIVDPLYGDL